MDRAGAMLSVAALQMPHCYGRVDEGLALVEQVLAGCEGIELLLLPEAALTGYVSPAGDFDLRRFAEPLEGPTARRLSELAARYRLALAGPLIEREGDAYYNALLLFDATGARVGHWRKRHPWLPETWATPGNLGTPVVSLSGFKVTAGICYDLHFLPEEASEALTEADVMLFPSAWVERGQDSRNELLPWLARDFGVSVVNANWARSVPAVHGQGGSRVLDRFGRVLARARDRDAWSLVRALVR